MPRIAEWHNACDAASARQFARCDEEFEYQPGLIAALTTSFKKHDRLNCDAEFRRRTGQY
jgi:hypothetical protein